MLYTIGCVAGMLIASHLVPTLPPFDSEEASVPGECGRRAPFTLDSQKLACVLVNGVEHETIRSDSPLRSIERDDTAADDANGTDGAGMDQGCHDIEDADAGSFVTVTADEFASMLRGVAVAGARGAVGNTRAAPSVPRPEIK